MKRLELATALSLALVPPASAGDAAQTRQGLSTNAYALTHARLSDQAPVAAARAMTARNVTGIWHDPSTTAQAATGSFWTAEAPAPATTLSGIAKSSDR